MYTKVHIKHQLSDQHFCWNALFLIALFFGLLLQGVRLRAFLNNKKNIECIQKNMLKVSIQQLYYFSSRYAQFFSLKYERFEAYGTEHKERRSAIFLILPFLTFFWDSIFLNYMCPRYIYLCCKQKLTSFQSHKSSFCLVFPLKMSIKYINTFANTWVYTHTSWYL
jgi:hypothetical protein